MEQIDNIEFFKDKNNFIGKTVKCDLGAGAVVYAINVNGISDKNRIYFERVIKCEDIGEKSITTYPAYDYVVSPQYHSYYIMTNEEADTEIKEFLFQIFCVQNNNQEIISDYLKGVWHDHTEDPGGMRSVVTYDGERYGDIGLYVKVNEGYVWAYMDDLFKNKNPMMVVEITQDIIDYIEKHRHLFEFEMPSIGDVWKVTSIEQYPVACDGKPVCILEFEENGSWMRLPKEICNVKYM